MSTTNTLDLNNRIDALEKAVSGGDSAQANKKDIATEFNTTTNYTAGNFVYYGGKLYQFNTDHTAGAWDPTDVVEANVTDQIVSNKAAIDVLDTEVTSLHYHKIAESESTGTTSSKLISLVTAYNNLSANVRKTAILVRNDVDVYQTINTSGDFGTFYVGATTTLILCLNVKTGTAYNNTNGTIRDDSATEDTRVYSLWVCE